MATRRGALNLSCLIWSAAVGSLNTSDELRYYPGSPLLAAKLLREQDLLMLTELHPTDFPYYVRNFSRDKRVRVCRKMAWTIKNQNSLPPVVVGLF